MPVNVFSTVSKILQNAVYMQVNKFLAAKNVIYQYQSGFYQNISTNICQVHLTDDIKGEIGSGHYVGMMAIDAQKALDGVNHDIFCKRLDIIGIESSWFKSYLSDRSQIVYVNGTNSKVDEII